ncbi:MAG TPA: hypothetical protein VLF17_07610 [Candidatus Nitrosotenuis sp.]|nr:hypothetical protein [Candidatus Nitrosotenuis sp.]
MASEHTNPKQEMAQMAGKIMSDTRTVKEILYEQINSITEQRIQKDISGGNTAALIKKIIDNCRSEIIGLGGSQHESFETLAESLMHYLLTNALIQSQRKVTHNATEIDIVIPDMRTLLSSPKDALVVLFPKTSDAGAILESLGKIGTVQPIKENIWLVEKAGLGLQYKTYEIDNGCSFSNIINDIASFLSSKAQSRLKIFKV